MGNFLYLISVCILFVLVLGAIPYLIVFLIHLFKRRWRKLAWMLFIPMPLIGVLGILDVLGERVSTEETSGRFLPLGEPLFEYDSERSFLGDGYSFSVYSLPEKIRRQFLNAPPLFFSEFPKRPAYRKGWQTGFWREAPVDPALQKYADFAFAESVDDGGRLEREIKMAKNALLHRGTFYAFFEKSYGDNVSNIDMFIVDLTKGRIYIINLNT